MLLQINLLPLELRKKIKKQMPVPEIPVIKSVAIFVAAVLLLQSLGWGYYAFLTTQVTQTRKQSQALAEKYKDITEKKAKTEVLNGKIGQLWDIFQAKFRYCLLLNAVSDCVVRGMWLRYFYVKEIDSPPGADGKSSGKDVALVLEGSISAQGQETAFVGKFIKELKENAYLKGLFSNVGLSTITQKQIKEIDVYDFSVFLIFKKECLPL